MKTTNKTSVLDDHKLDYELTNGDPQKKKTPKAVQLSTLTKKLPKPRRQRRASIIRTYFNCLVEVILA